MTHEKDVLGEESYDQTTRECIEEEQSRLARFLGKFSLGSEEGE
jgi:hypothetical protein